MRAAPAVSRAKAEIKSAHEHTGSAEAVRPSLRNGFTAYFVLSLATGLFVTIARVMRSIIANLTPASGRQDHTTSPSVARAVRPGRANVHRIPPRVRDDREPPLCEAGRLGLYADLRFLKIRIFFQKGLDSHFAKRPDGQISGAFPRPSFMGSCHVDARKTASNPVWCAGEGVNASESNHSYEGTPLGSRG